MGHTNDKVSSGSVISDDPKCSICGRQFDDMAEMQRHTLTEHLQKGNIPEE